MEPHFGMLPVRRRRNVILDKVSMNRVTLIFAETGSGKSSQVPQILLEEGLTPILCTQPRRLAVVSVSKLVAEQRKCVLGEEVGFHIGQMNKTSARSKLVFQTAGVLLEELRARGVNALSRYKVVILDEVHERSVESDLVLCCVKLFMSKNKNIRLVLMSATADFQRYEKYFSDLEETVETIAISTFSKMVQTELFSCTVKYLDHVVKLLGNKNEHLTMLESVIESPSPSERGTDIGHGIHRLICELIIYIHEQEPDVRKSVLVFLPSYRSLEEQWSLLKKSGLDLELYVLHRSIDLDQSMEAMEASNSSLRKVILATDVAESSVTIPGTSFVIDSCRCCEIHWINGISKDVPRIVWASQSQAEQRKGRTGRTCNGVVYRMVPRQVYGTFQKYEQPAMQLLSLRDQVLLLVSAETRALNDPKAFLLRCLNPPLPQTIENALDALRELNALECDGRGKCKPTLYGKLLSALPLSLKASILVVEGAEHSLLHECAVLACILDTSPRPIVKPFGESADYSLKFFQHLFDGSRPSQSSSLIANLCAFEFWQCMFKDQLRWAKLLTGRLSGADSKALEKAWCARHNLSQFSLHMVAETYHCVLEVMHRFRPESVTLYVGPPSYYRATFNHHCSDFNEDNGTICELTPYVRNGDFHTIDEEAALSKTIEEAHSKVVQMSPVDGYDVESSLFDPVGLSGESSAQCVYFRMGTCSKGVFCPYSHSAFSRPPPCKYFRTGTGCRYGVHCHFTHDTGSSKSRNTIEFGKQVFLFETLCSYIHLPDSTEPVLLFGKETLSYAHRLRPYIGCQSPIWVACCESRDSSGLVSNVDVDRVLWSVDPSSFNPSALDRIPKLSEWKDIKCMMFNFPLKYVHDADQHKAFVHNLLGFLARMQMKFERNGLYLLLTMTMSEFSQCQVERTAREYFFFLVSSFLVNPAFFGETDNSKPIKLVTYVFKQDFPVGRFLQNA